MLISIFAPLILVPVMAVEQAELESGCLELCAKEGTKIAWEASVNFFTMFRTHSESYVATCSKEAKTTYSAALNRARDNSISFLKSIKEQLPEEIRHCQ